MNYESESYKQKTEYLEITLSKNKPIVSKEFTLETTTIL